MSKTTNKFSPEVRERAVRMVLDHEGDYRSTSATRKARGSGAPTKIPMASYASTFRKVPISAPIIPRRLLLWLLRSTAGPVKRWAGKHPRRRLTNASLRSKSSVLRRPVESAQYVSIRYSERLAEAGIEPSVGSVGDSYDNALAETINGLYKAEVIHRRGSWRSFEAVEFATLEWVDWFNNRRLLEPIGNIPPAEAEAQYYAMLDDVSMAA
ncbi:integrase, catalytic region (plasmid) [Sphingobium sp. TKS]|nr:integrase, catalytic region [Sphingobium sp. TKS]